MATTTPATCKTISPIIIGGDGSLVEGAVSPDEAEFLRGWQL